ncbi:MAG TPA: DUF6516 family protein [Gammaproteobacteria bacterium]|nr:DUF6516 family protein [Gammaproteobacteria bacterium]
MAKKKNTGRSIKTETLLVDESISIHKKKGNGVIRRRIWVDVANKVTRYSLAYINHHLSHDDNGRVLGYDNAHGYHHKHYMGKVEPITLTNIDEIEKRFQKEFEVLHEQAKKR